MAFIAEAYGTTKQKKCDQKQEQPNKTRKQ